MTPVNPSRSDSDLVRAAQAGDIASFGALIERHLGMVYAIAMARLRDAEIADDLAQEVFLRAQLHLGSLGSRDRFAAWISRIARNLAIDWRRSGQRASRLLPMVPLGEEMDCIPDTDQRGAREAMESKEESRALRRAIFDLPEAEREVVLLHFSVGLTQRQIAERLGISQSTVGRQIQHALGALRQALGPALREIAPSLRVSQRTVARALAMTAAVGTMSASTKVTLAASATVSHLAMATEAVGVGATSAVGVLGFLKSLPAFIAGGAQIMATGKGITAALAAVAVITAGGILINTRGEESTAATQGSSVERRSPIPAHEGVYALAEGNRQIELLRLPDEDTRRLMDMVDLYEETDETDVGDLIAEIENLMQRMSPPVIPREIRVQIYDPERLRQNIAGATRRIYDVDPVSLRSPMTSLGGSERYLENPNVPGLLEVILGTPIPGDLLVVIRMTDDPTERAVWVGMFPAMADEQVALQPMELPSGIFAVTADNRLIGLSRLSEEELVSLENMEMRIRRGEAEASAMRDLLDRIDPVSIPRSVSLIINRPDLVGRRRNLISGNPGDWKISQVMLSDLEAIDIGDMWREMERPGTYEVTFSEPLVGDALGIFFDSENPAGRVAWIARVTDSVTRPPGPPPDLPWEFSVGDRNVPSEPSREAPN